MRTSISSMLPGMSGMACPRRALLLHSLATSHAYAQAAADVDDLRIFGSDGLLRHQTVGESVVRVATDTASLVASSSNRTRLPSSRKKRRPFLVTLGICRC